MQPAHVAIDPTLVSKVKLRSGDEMPTIGLGTFGSDHIAHTTVAEAVSHAIRLGYRHVDCAAVYGNEKHIGRALSDLIGDRLSRHDIWISSKLWNDRHLHVAQACEQTLGDLGLDHLDMYLVHWPFPNHHPPDCDVDQRNPDAVAYSHDRFMETWTQMEALVHRGLTRHIGTSNMTIPKLDLLLRDATIAPAVNQMELHPHFQQPELFDYLVSEAVIPIGFCPIGSPGRPERDTTPDDTSPTDDPVIIEIARRLGVHPAVVCIKWAAQRGQVPIPFSTNQSNLRANLEAVTSPPLTAEDMARIAAIDQNCRLIKGQVFLWRDDQPWQDLWDLDGVIAP